jgi:hypothetical protein
MSRSSYQNFVCSYLLLYEALTIKFANSPCACHGSSGQKWHWLPAFHSCVVVDLWKSLSEWCLLLCECVLVCRRENVRAWIRATNEH